MGWAFGPVGQIRSPFAEPSPIEQQSLAFEQHINPDGLAVRRLSPARVGGLAAAHAGRLVPQDSLGERLDRGDAFATRVLSDARIFVIGGPDELGKLAGDRAPASARA